MLYLTNMLPPSKYRSLRNKVVTSLIFIIMHYGHWIMTLQICPCLNHCKLWICYLTMAKGILQMWLITGFEIGRLSWVIPGGPKCKHKRYWSNEGECNVTAEVEIRVIGPEANQCNSSRSWKSQRTDSPPEWTSPTNSLRLAS